jgi:hypothetical protein
MGFIRTLSLALTAGGGLVKNAFLDALIDRQGDRGEHQLSDVFVAGGNGFV